MSHLLYLRESPNLPCLCWVSSFKSKSATNLKPALLLTSPYSKVVFFMSKKRKRISRRRLAGQRVMAHVPIYHIETGKHKPVTAARRFIAENGLSAPSVFNVRRNEHTTDRFFWGEKGLFSAQYAEENHFLFPSLKVVVEGIGEEKIFEGLELTADDWEEIEEYEYAFV